MYVRTYIHMCVCITYIRTNNSTVLKVGVEGGKREEGRRERGEREAGREGGRGGREREREGRGEKEREGREGERERGREGRKGERRGLSVVLLIAKVGGIYVRTSGGVFE